MHLGYSVSHLQYRTLGSSNARIFDGDGEMHSELFNGKDYKFFVAFSLETVVELSFCRFLGSFESKIGPNPFSLGKGRFLWHIEYSKVHKKIKSAEGTQMQILGKSSIF